MTANLEELTALDALGVLSADEEQELETLRRERTVQAEAERVVYAEAAALIASSLEPVEPPDAIRAALLAGVRAPDVVRAEAGQWLEIFAGVQIRKLRSDRTRSTVTSLLRIAPGAVYPGHSHKGAEESFVVSGSCHFGAIALAEGDFIRIEPGCGHGDVTTEAGCVLLVVSDWADVAA